MAINVKKVLIGAGAVVLAYQAYKMFTKPKSVEPKSNASGASVLKYKKSDGKVYKVVGTGFDAKYVRLSEPQQPKAMDWFNLNGKWVWTKWNGKLDTAQVPNKFILS